MRISDRELLPGGGGFLGDYTGATFSNLGFFSTWPDTRNDEADIYSAWWNLDDEFAIVSPNGGESWALQQPCTLRWHYRYAPDSLFVELNRSYPAGPWERLDTVRASARQWNWTSTGPVTSAARFRLIGINVPSVGDSSDADFSIEGLVAPERLTARRIGQDIRLRWLSTGAPYYRIYSALAVEDSLLTYEGTTSSTVFIDSAAVADSRKFYIIRASSEP
jgi:hypothetical protein